MIRKTSLFFVLALVSIVAIASAGNGKNLKTFTGILTCLACDLKHLEGTNSQCEVFGHRHSLRLDNGEYIYFLENDHSETLIKGGGRHDTRIKVTGIYNKKAHTIDVQNYEIDGVKTEWCKVHERMDMCGDKAAASTESSVRHSSTSDSP